jgi:hypothetical protein
MAKDIVEMLCTIPSHGSPRIIGETVLAKCDNDRMARRQTRRSTGKTTEWNLGQPLAFPPKLNCSEFERLTPEAVEEAMSGSLKRKRPKRKKK